MAKYKALKKFFDRLKNRDGMNSKATREKEYYDMGGEIADEPGVSSDGSTREYSFLGGPNNPVVASNV